MKRREKETYTVSKIIRLKTCGPGKTMGVEDYMSKSNDRKYTYTATIKSLHCKVLMFNRENAYQKLQNNEKTLRCLTYERASTPTLTCRIRQPATQHENQAIPPVTHYFTNRPQNFKNDFDDHQSPKTKNNSYVFIVVEWWELLIGRYGSR